MTQPLAYPFCNAPRIGIDGPRHVYKCGSVFFIFPDRKPKAERSQRCVDNAAQTAEAWRAVSEIDPNMPRPWEWPK